MIVTVDKYDAVLTRGPQGQGGSKPLFDDCNQAREGGAILRDTFAQIGVNGQEI